MADLSMLFQNGYSKSFIILISFILVANIIHLFLRTYIKAAASKTKTDIDDIILGIVTKPLYMGLILAGLYFSLRYLPAAAPYWSWINSVFFILLTLFGAFVLSKIMSFSTNRLFKVQKKFESDTRRGLHLRDGCGLLPQPAVFVRFSGSP